MDDYMNFDGSPATSTTGYSHAPTIPDASGLAGVDVGETSRLAAAAALTVLFPTVEMSIERLAGNASQLVNRTLEALPEVARLAHCNDLLAVKIVCAGVSACSIYVNRHLRRAGSGQDRLPAHRQAQRRGQPSDLGGTGRSHAAGSFHAHRWPGLFNACDSLARFVQRV
jgi:hypothetical protein